ncbi:carbohydrate kinase [Psychrosphaera sp. B3R10]|nr:MULTISPECIES: carbohydrate kinase [unclassified Psychrosphaera]MBU2882737.1 carbohydrate kinase [Psychrosphaera sp. I2R16]MBU2989245.1 carbohydrate kinase [Psychrosphaera sp. B3R10]
MMDKVICFGEALIDMLSTEPEKFTQYPGGAPANAAVAVSKLGGNAIFCGMLGNDTFGNYLFNKFVEYGVEINYVAWTLKAKTALAFVTLDASGERSFEFYRPPSADLLFTPDDFDIEMFAVSSIFHYCSNSLTETQIEQSTYTGIQHAVEHNCIVSMDVNLRINLWPENGDYKSKIIKSMKSANIIKVSLEELHELVPADEADDFLAALLTQQCQLILLTDGAKPIVCMTKNRTFGVPTPIVDVVDTTAAGDAFIGGFLYQLSKQKVKLNTLENFVDSPQLNKSVSFAAQCGAHTVTQQGAFPALPDQAMVSYFEQEGNG